MTTPLPQHTPPFDVTEVCAQDIALCGSRWFTVFGLCGRKNHRRSPPSCSRTAIFLYLSGICICVNNSRG